MLIEIHEKWSGSVKCIKTELITEVVFSKEYAELKFSNGTSMNADTAVQDLRTQLVQLGVIAPALRCEPTDKP
jgi:hypothetical protein